MFSSLCLPRVIAVPSTSGVIGVRKNTGDHRLSAGTALCIPRLCSDNSVPLSALCNRRTRRHSLEDLPWPQWAVRSTAAPRRTSHNARGSRSPASQARIPETTADHSLVVAWAASPIASQSFPGVRKVISKDCFGMLSPLRHSSSAAGRKLLLYDLGGSPSLCHSSLRARPPPTKLYDLD